MKKYSAKKSELALRRRVLYACNGAVTCSELSDKLRPRNEREWEKIGAQIDYLKRVGKLSTHTTRKNGRMVECIVATRPNNQPKDRGKP